MLQLQAAPTLSLPYLCVVGWGRGALATVQWDGVRGQAPAPRLTSHRTLGKLLNPSASVYSLARSGQLFHGAWEMIK